MLLTLCTPHFVACTYSSRYLQFICCTCPGGLKELSVPSPESEIADGQSLRSFRREKKKKKSLLERRRGEGREGKREGKRGYAVCPEG